MGFFNRSQPQPDPITPPPFQPAIRSHVVRFPASRQDVRDLITVCDGIDGVRLLVQRHGADAVQRWLSLVAVQEGHGL